MTTRVTGVDFVSIPTRGFDAAREFYATTLGLECSATYGRVPGADGNPLMLHNRYAPRTPHG